MDSMDDTLDELEGYVSYFEDVPVEWLKKGASRFSRISERLQRLKESQDKQITEEKEWS